MAKVTKRPGEGKRILAQGIGKAFGQLAQGLVQAGKDKKEEARLEVSRKNAQTQADFFKIKKQQSELQLDEAQERKRTLGVSRMNTIMGEGILTEDPKVFLKNRENDFLKASQDAESSMTVETFREVVTINNERAKSSTKDMLGAKKSLFMFNPLSGGRESLGKISEKGLNAFNQLIGTPELSDNARQEFVSQRKEFEKAIQQTSNQMTKAGIAREQQVTKIDDSAQRKTRRSQDLKIKFQEKVNKDGVIKQLDDSLTAADRIESVAQEALVNPLASGNISRQLAKLAGESGRLTEQDVADFKLSGTGSLSQRLNSIINKAAKGTLTKQEVTFITRFTKTMRIRIAKSRDKRALKLTKQFSKASDINEDELRDIIDIGDSPQPNDIDALFEGI